MYQSLAHRYFFGALALRRLYSTYAKASANCTATIQETKTHILGADVLTILPIDDGRCVIRFE